jgi:hypothetical protein
MKIIRLIKILLCFLFITFINSCNSKNVKKEVTQNNNIKVSDQKVDLKKVNKNYGFLVYSDVNKQKKTITIYNEDKSIWKEFILNDSYFENENFKPQYIKSEYKKLIFKCIEMKNGFYKVIVNEDKKTIKYIINTDVNFKFQTPSEHIITVVFVGINDKLNPLFEEPNINSKQLLFNKNEDYSPIKTRKEWLMLEDSNHQNYWIKWCDKSGNIILELFYDA